MKKKILIVGGVAGGASCAARLRRLDEEVEIVLLEKGPHISFANCGLPYYIGDVIKERESLLVQTPEAMRDRFKIDVRVNNEVLKINREDKTVVIKDLILNKEYIENYDELVLSCGSSPLHPPIPGIDAKQVLSLWNMVDTDKIKQYLSKNTVKHATVIGGGFIGIEMVENLRHLDIEVDLVELADQVMTTIDHDMVQLIHNELCTNGVRLYLKNGVKQFTELENKCEIQLQDDTKIVSDLVILAIGVRPNSKLASECGLKCNQRQGVVVDDYMKTSDDNIFAIGDMIEVTNYVNQEKTMIPLAGPANKQGRIVANNICNIKDKYDGSHGTSVAKIFDLTVASTGLNERQLQNSGLKYRDDYQIAIIQSMSHASYYPQALPMTLKLIFANDGKILGAQNIGYEGVEKRIDVISTAIKFKAQIADLTRLELSYAPPYSSAKDPVNMIGYVAENILADKMDCITAKEMAEVNSDEYQIVDVRDELECELGTIKNSINIPLNSLRDNLALLDLNKKVIVYCAVGLRGYIATRILLQNGFTVKNLLGGYNFYKYYYKNYNEPSATTCQLSEVKMIDTNDEKLILIDACGLQCPGPILQLKKRIDTLDDGEIVKIMATDPGFCIDAKTWAERTNNTFIKQEKTDKTYIAYIQKGSNSVMNNIHNATTNSSTMVVFSGDFDKAVASFIIANGAAAMGKEVTMFFTFWGLNILRKTENVSVNKSFMEAMFAKMMPQGTSKLTISKMNMLGAGTKMIKSIMHKKNVLSLEELIKEAQSAGVKLVACTMSMDIMGIKEEELIDGVDFGGVATYLGAADQSNHNLFI